MKRKVTGGRRYRNNYLWIYIVLGVAWVMAVCVHPVPVSEVGAFFERAAVGPVPGELIFGPRTILQARY